LLNDLNLDAFWEDASSAERRILINDLIDSVNIFPDRLTVQVAGVLPFLVTLKEVGLNQVGLNQGCKPVVSESRRQQSNGRTSTWEIGD